MFPHLLPHLRGIRKLRVEWSELDERATPVLLLEDAALRETTLRELDSDDATPQALLSEGQHRISERGNPNVCKEREREGKDQPKRRSQLVRRDSSSDMA
jgi:hypothetical protein